MVIPIDPAIQIVGALGLLQHLHFVRVFTLKVAVEI